MKYYFIDLFCGAGGVTSGIYRAKYNGENFAQVIACVNHDATAILTHAANHPEVLHYTEDIRTLDLTEIKNRVDYIRATEPDAIICLWASLECTNFSKAKGGMARNADSRTLAEHLLESEDEQGNMKPRYIPVLQPDMVWIENVEEFMSWGPLDAKGKPESRKAGIDYMRWIEAVKRHGYNFDHRILNAADYGAFTSRKRFFAQFAKPEIEIAWPQPTHAKVKQAKVADMFSQGTGLKKWQAVRDVLNLTDTGESIFIPGRIKSDKTFWRIYHGLIKFVAGGKQQFEAFITKYHSGQNPAKRNRNYSIEQPLNTVDTENRFYLVNPVFIIQRTSGEPLSKIVDLASPARTVTTTGGNMEVVSAEFLMKNFSGHPESKTTSLDEPCCTIRTVDTTDLVKAEFLISYHHSDKTASIENPLPTLTCKDKKAFISAYYGNGHNCTAIDSPSPTVTGGDRFVLVSPNFIYRDFSNAGFAQSVEAPAGAVQTNPKLNLVTAEQFLSDMQYDASANRAKALDEPIPAQTSSRHQYYLINPQWFGNGGSIDSPCFTIIARQDKAPASLVCIETGCNAIEICETDQPHALLIKAFMVLYGISDVKMRMLDIQELLRIQGFGDDYKLMGSKTKQKWMLGNAVEVNQAKVLIEASYKANFETGMIVAA